MPEIVICPKCRRQARVPDSLMGHKVKCPGCDETFTAEVPASQPPSAPKEAEPRKSARTDDDAVSDRTRSGRKRDEEKDAEDDRPRRSRSQQDEEEDESRRKRSRHDDDEEPARRRPPVASQGADVCGIISVVIGGVSIVLLPIGCCCGPLWFGVIPLALAGCILTIWARSTMRIIGLILNILAILPSIALCILIIVGVTLPAAMNGGAGGNPFKPGPVVPKPPPRLK